MVHLYPERDYRRPSARVIPLPVSSTRRYRHRKSSGLRTRYRLHARMAKCPLTGVLLNPTERYSWNSAMSRVMSDSQFRFKRTSKRLPQGQAVARLSLRLGEAAPSTVLAERGCAPRPPKR